jgi:hypothetical protein
VRAEGREAPHSGRDRAALAVHDDAGGAGGVGGAA